MLDNFPRNRAQLATIQEVHAGIMPDILFCLKDNDGERKTDRRNDLCKLQSKCCLVYVRA